MNARIAEFHDARHKFTLDDWAAMDRAGILPPDMKFELIDGDLIEMPAEGYAHRRYQAAIVEWIVPHLRAAGLVASIDQTLPVDGHFGPRPDLYLYRRDIHERDLAAKDVLWVIEIADSSLEKDRDVKGPLYATAGIPEYWIVDVSRKAILAHRRPGPDGYAEVETVPADGAAAPLCLSRVTLRLADLPRLD